MKLFVLNEGQKRQKTTTTRKNPKKTQKNNKNQKKTKNNNFKYNNRSLNKREISPKFSIYEIISVWVKLITLLGLHTFIAVRHFDTVFVLIGYSCVR